MDTPSKTVPNTIRNKKYWSSLRRLRLSLKYRPEILKLFLRMKQCIRKKNVLLKNLNHQLKFMKQRKQYLGLNIKDDCQQHDSDDLLPLKTNYNVEEQEIKKLNKSQTIQIKSEFSTNHVDNDVDCSNITKMDIIFNDKSTSCECSVKDGLSQTKSDNDLHIEDGIKSILLDDKNEEATLPGSKTNDFGNKNCNEKSTFEVKDLLSQTCSDQPNIKEVYTQTDITFEESKAIDISVKNLVKGQLIVKDSFTQTDDLESCVDKAVADNKINTLPEDQSSGWTNIAKEGEEQSIAEQVKEVAQSAMQQSGVVYVESAGLYYDYKTGYYYNSELGLYYHTDTGCYYYYSDEQKIFLFHSYPDRSNEVQNRPIKPLRKSKVNKKAKKSDDIENLTKNLSQDEEDLEASKPKRRRLSKLKKSKKDNKSDIGVKDNDNKDDQKDRTKKENFKVENEGDSKLHQELEEGECSSSSYEKSDNEIEESDASTATASDDESVAKHHPPCMRVVVRETSLPKLKVGSLFLVTKDGGTIGREGEHHSILLKDYNVSRNHLDIKFNADKRIYMAMDLGSKNGTILNGVRMSKSLEVSEPMEVVHGSTLQLGETKLLCHIHAGNDTCGHCEPGLIMEAEDKEKKVAYTRTCSVQIQHQLELARLKNKYAPQPLAILDTEYNDRAKTRRDKFGSSHHAEKTQCSDLDTSIAADNKGFKLLEKMGWSKGEGLGKDGQGDTEPIPLISNEGKSGLGAASAPSVAPVITSKIGPATLRLAARTKMLRPPAKVFQQPTEEDSE